MSDIFRQFSIDYRDIFSDIFCRNRHVLTTLILTKLTLNCDLLFEESPEVRLAEIQIENYAEEKNLTDQILELLEDNTLNLTGISLRFDNFQGLNLSEVVKQLEAKSENLTMEIDSLAEQIRNASYLEAQAYSLKLKDVSGTNETVVGNATEATTVAGATTSGVETTTTPVDWDLFCEQLPAETGIRKGLVVSARHKHLEKI